MAKDDKNILLGVPHKLLPRAKEEKVAAKVTRLLASNQVDFSATQSLVYDGGVFEQGLIWWHSELLQKQSKLKT